MRKLWLDFETRSYCDLKDCGLDRYANDQTTEVLMLAWAFDDDEVELWLPILGEPMPEELQAGLNDPDTMLMAWNYNFEKAIFAYKLKMALAQKRWFDPSVLCAYMALPIGLDRAANACGIDISLKKSGKAGKSGIKLFSEPSKRKKNELKKNPDLSPTFFKDWNTDPEKWAEFCDYCKQDVRAERGVWYSAVDFNCPMPSSEIQAWLLDQRMNEAGVWIDVPFVENAKNYAEKEAAGIVEDMKSVTGCENPNSPKQLKDWMATQGCAMPSMDKAHVAEWLKEKVRLKLSQSVVALLELKQKLGGSAYKKLESILNRISPDGRLRNQFMYHGAHTGRWSGRGVQLQNLFKAIKTVSTVLDPVSIGIRNGNLDIPAIVAKYNAGISAWNAENPTQKPKPELKVFTMMEAVAGTIRSSFAATPGNKLSVGDLAQIESRVLAGLAGCKTMIDAYANGLDLYKDIMSFLLEKPYDQITSQERANGKVIILGCGFGMGWEKFIDYAATFGVTLDEPTAKRYVNAFRDKYVEIPSFWKELNAACVKAVKLNICVYVRGLVVDGRNPQMLKIKLPSGRYLHYLRPVATEEVTDWGATREGVSYESWDEKGLNMKRLYGGLLCENVVQAVARDILLNGMVEAEKMGFLIIMTIHDEVVGESLKDGILTHKDLLKALTMTPDWAEGLGFVLAAEGYDCEYYKK